MTTDINSTEKGGLQTWASVADGHRWPIRLTVRFGLTL